MGGIPVIVGGSNFGLPVIFDEVLEVLAISGSGIWDVVIGKPSLELGFVPFIVYYCRDALVGYSEVGK